MTADSKPRTWWISFWQFSNHFEIKKQRDEMSDPTRTDILVIEHSAYAKLETERDSLERECQALRSVLSEWDTDKSCYTQMIEADAIRRDRTKA